MKKIKNIYMIGIKGVGMTMLAQFLADRYNISGSDIEDVFLTDKVLKKEKIKVSSPFDINNVPEKIDWLIYSSAFNADNNVELDYVLKNYKGIKVTSYAQALGELFNQYKGIAVCGSHGKTTVSAWLGYVLDRANKNPNVLVGSRVPQFKGSSIKGSSKLFVAEVDEYQNKLQYFKPYGAVLNNIDFDHPDFFKTKKDYVKVFEDFIKKIPKDGFLVINNEDKNIREIRDKCKTQIISHQIGREKKTEEAVNYLAHNLRQTKTGQVFEVNNLGEFRVKLLGEHSVLNALSVIASARELGVSIEKIREHLNGFKGTERRAQVMGKYKGVIIIDDYAHHPVEIQTTLQGVKEAYKDRNIITVFHPHTFTRTKALFKEFSKSFGNTNELIVLDIYGSAREKQGGVSSRDLVKEIVRFNTKNNIKQKVHHIPSLETVHGYLRKNLKKNDLVLLMGAGDVFRIGKELLK